MRGSRYGTKTNVPEPEVTAEVSRPVLGAEMTEEAPQVVYIPTAAPMRGEDLTVVLRELEDASVALLVYSSLDLLVDGCGEEQPWIGFHTAGLEELQHQVGADLVLWDATLAPEIRQYGEYGEDS